MRAWLLCTPGLLRRPIVHGQSVVIGSGTWRGRQLFCSGSTRAYRLRRVSTRVERLAACAALRLIAGHCVQGMRGGWRVFRFHWHFVGMPHIPIAMSTCATLLIVRRSSWGKPPRPRVCQRLCMPATMYWAWAWCDAQAWPAIVDWVASRHAVLRHRADGGYSYLRVTKAVPELCVCAESETSY